MMTPFEKERSFNEFKHELLKCKETVSEDIMNMAIKDMTEIIEIAMSADKYGKENHTDPKVLYEIYKIR